MKARSLLAQRLKRHKVALSAATLSLLLSQNAASAAVPASLVVTTLQTATAASVGQAASAGLASTKIATLAQGTVKSMLLANLKFVAATLIGLTVAALGLQSQRGEKTAANELPTEVKAALGQNAKQLGPFSITYTRQIKSTFPEQETFDRLKMSPEDVPRFLFDKATRIAIWQSPRFYAMSKHISTPRMAFDTKTNQTLVERQVEWSFDGTIQYRGDRHDEPNTPAYLHKKLSSRGRIGETPLHVMSGPYFKGFSGLSFRQNGSELTALESQSDILALLQNGGKLVSVENVLLDEHPCVKIDVISENVAKRRAEAEDLAAIRSGTRTQKDPDRKEEKLQIECTAEVQKELAENITRQQNLPETKRIVFYLDPALNYALRRREEWYDPDRLLVRSDCSEFEKLPDRPVWLPRHCQSEFHEFERFFQFYFRKPGHGLQYNTTLSFYFDDAFLTEVLEVSEMSGLPVPVEQFVLNYTEPGAQINDETIPVSAKNPSGRTNYTVGKTPQETQRNQAIAATQEREEQEDIIPANAAKPKSTIHWLLLANGIVVLLIVAFVAWRRFLR